MHQVADVEIWTRIREEAARDAHREPMLASFLHTVVLNHARLEDALSFILAEKLGSATVTALTLRDLIAAVFEADRSIATSVRADLQAVVSRDPACRGYSVPLLYFKGFHALQAYRVAHHYWTTERTALALYLQSRISEVLAVDIHPGARIGKGILFDHATSVVIGETAVVEDDFSMLHEVTLGGTGKHGGIATRRSGGASRSAPAPRCSGTWSSARAKIGAGSAGPTRRPSPLHGGGHPRAPGRLPLPRAAGARDGPVDRRRRRPR